ncbi:MAG: glycosyltransferase [Planctomycetaceae bacterium]|nr:glycosyltransferase [Planctomycetaceae bacterium]
MTSNPTLEEIRKDCFVLDSEDFQIPENVRLISPENFSTIASIPEISVEYIPPGRLATCFKRIPFLYYLLWSLRLLFAADKNTVIIVIGSGGFFLPLGFLNRLAFFCRRTILLWGLFVEYRLGRERRLWFFPFVKFKMEWKEAIARFVMQGYSQILVWSRKEVTGLAKYYKLPESLFLFFRYKANHSKRPTYDIPLNNFVFSGGNGKRDYKTLVEAVRGTDVPLIISATKPQFRQEIEFAPNVIMLGAPEPAFGQLQAACRFAVVAMMDSSVPGIKGGGEANLCNPGWHGKPVIALDNMSAEDYIVEGVTGFIVPCGDVELLRKRILQLWNDPELCRQMGENARKHVEKHFTHFLFIRRTLRLAFILGQQKIR